MAGYLILKGALKSVEVDALNAALDDQAGVDGMLAWPAGHREPFRDPPWSILYWSGISTRSAAPGSGSNTFLACLQMQTPIQPATDRRR